MNRRRRGLRIACSSLIALFVASVFGGCTQDVLLGGGGAPGASSSSSSGAGVCAGLPCGASCIYTPCDDSGCSAAEAGYCDANGTCALTAPSCVPYVACDASSVKCGDSCWPCDPTSPSCNPAGKLYTCTEGFKCLPGQATCSCTGVDCPPPLPCSVASCGTPCSCDPMTSANCPDTMSPTFCDGSGNCLALESVSCPKGYHPCDNKKCGTSCSPCKPGDAHCAATGNFVCDINGQCTVAPVACFAKCTPARCGKSCTPCDPTNPECTPPAHAFCDKYGGCVAGVEPSYCPCTGLACGASCSFCDPMDPHDPDCATQPQGACDDSSVCTASTPPPTCSTP